MRRCKDGGGGAAPPPLALPSSLPVRLQVHVLWCLAVGAPPVAGSGVSFVGSVVPGPGSGGTPSAREGAGFLGSLGRHGRSPALPPSTSRRRSGPPRRRLSPRPGSPCPCKDGGGGALFLTARRRATGGRNPVLPGRIRRGAGWTRAAGSAACGRLGVEALPGAVRVAAPLGRRRRRRDVPDSCSSSALLPSSGHRRTTCAPPLMRLHAS